MTLTSIKTELIKARDSKYAVPLYDVFDQFGVDGVFDALEMAKAPVILGIYSGARVMETISAFSAYITNRAEKSCYPVSIMLDHGSSVEKCLYALENGFTDIMYDGSNLPYEENIENTIKVVEAAHACGASVEAELGHVGVGSEYDSYGGKRIGFTDPNMVEDFVRRTNVDFLAIAFGNAHGMYKGEPKIDLDLIRTVYQKVDVPLVMHGGSGLSDGDYKEIIKAGIAKINFFTTIHNAASQMMVEAAKGERPSMFSISEQIRLAYKETCTYYFDIFGSTGKA